MKLYLILFDNFLQLVVNARSTTQLRNPLTSKPLELDLWLPKLKLAFEFQVNTIFI